MEYNERRNLIDKYLNGRATDEEAAALMQWYRAQLQEDVVWESDSPEEESLVKARIAQKIRLATHQLEAQTTTEVRRGRWKWAVAVVAAGLFGALLLLRVVKKDKQPLAAEEVTLLAGVDTKEDAEENRFVLLPDSSKVILRPGSKLEYRTDFKGSTREVALVGEGYFEIQRDEGRPFVVHAGDVRTVVLGTAFTVKAEEGQDDVRVTVQHGKVRVEKREKVLAELVANQQLDVDTKTAIAEQKVIVAEEALSWTAEDMRFDDQPFGQLTDRLQRRYGMTIAFKNRDLASCPVSGRFTGTETLDEVLMLLCATRNAKYERTTQGTIEIDGPGCR